VHMLHVAPDPNRAKKLQPRCPILQHRQTVVKENGVLDDVWPQGKMHGSCPMSTSVEQLLPHALQNFSNCALRYPILEVGVNPTEGKSLMTAIA
jgi:hypothetical protein